MRSLAVNKKMKVHLYQLSPAVLLDGTPLRTCAFEYQRINVKLIKVSKALFL